MCVCVCNVPLEFSRIDDPHCVKRLTEKNHLPMSNISMHWPKDIMYVYMHVYIYIYETTKASKKKSQPCWSADLKLQTHFPHISSVHISFVK